jgi:hypothetical protein
MSIPPTPSGQGARSEEQRAVLAYDKILKDEIYPLVGDKTTYLSQLNEAGHKIFGPFFKGTYASDKIPRLNDLARYCILNLDKSHEPGSHWVALAKEIDIDGCIVYDSFGRKTSQIIPNLYFSGNGRLIQTDPDSEQKIHETDCGARCLAWLVFLDRYGPEAALLI